MGWVKFGFVLAAVGAVSLACLEGAGPAFTLTVDVAPGSNCLAPCGFFCDAQHRKHGCLTNVETAGCSVSSFAPASCEGVEIFDWLDADTKEGVCTITAHFDNGDSVTFTVTETKDEKRVTFAPQSAEVTIPCELDAGADVETGDAGDAD